MSTAQHLFVISYSGELSVKAKRTRRRFTERVAQNLAEALDSRGIAHHIAPTWARLMLRSASAEAGEVAARVFGCHSIWPADERPWQSLADIVRDGEELFAPAVAGKTFAVRVRRGETKQEIPFRSPEVERALGARLLPHAAGVDLTSPEVVVRVELRRRAAFFMSRPLAGPGGFPLGTEGRAVALVSGGFDSLVAAWLLLRRGVILDFAFCNLAGDAHRDAVLEVLKVLADGWCFGYRPQLHMVDFGSAVEEIRAACPPSLWQVVLKRQMLRVADRIARMSRALAIVTGDAVGQVSSQTLHNLAAISTATELPILRPLVGAHKEEIVDLARHIGTYELSATIPEYCAIAPRHPETHARVARVAKAEAALDGGLLEGLIGARAIFDLRAFDLDKMSAPELEVDEVPAGTVVVDLRSALAFKGWHYPGALRLDYLAALEAYRSFDRGQTYLFYCEVGLKSAHLAELLNARGVRAYHFRGGLKRIRRYAEGHDAALRAVQSPVLLEG